MNSKFTDGSNQKPAKEANMADSYPKPTDPRFKDLTNRQFGSAVVHEYRGRNKWGGFMWLIFCDPEIGGCGKKKIMEIRRDTQSCGCLQRKIAAQTICKRNTTHGLTRDPAYHRWHRMKERCYDPKDRAFEHYGGRGIYVCREWQAFEPFHAWILTIFPDGKIAKGMTIERRDNDGPYSPDNCYFATKKQQARNRRSGRLVTMPDGRTITLAQCAEEIGINYKVLHRRLSLGWSIARALH